MAIVNFQDLADLTTQTGQQPLNADFLDAACRVFLDAIDETCLFTWCRRLNYRDVTETPIGNLCNLISLRIRDTWDINIAGTELELRCQDLWGDTLQLDMDKTIAETLDVWRPRWREFHGCFDHCPSSVPKATPFIFRVTVKFQGSFCLDAKRHRPCSAEMKLFRLQTILVLCRMRLVVHRTVLYFFVL